MSEYNKLDTGAFEAFISSQNSLKQRYDIIKSSYSTIVTDLLKNWKGRGADAFKVDSEKVIANLVGIQDILSTMCDTLSDCYDIFSECDCSIGTNNRNALKKAK